MLVQFLSLFYWIYLFPVSSAPMFITAICFFLPLPSPRFFFSFPLCSENTITLAAPAAADADALNSISLRYCNVRGGQGRKEEGRDRYGEVGGRRNGKT